MSYTLKQCPCASNIRCSEVKEGGTCDDTSCKSYRPDAPPAATKAADVDKKALILECVPKSKEV
ncbi:MAG: hypothetical protein D4S01_07365 [Dehalococcoidia bacterium]|nr:MAG: hypothetical protein D4S01_07365 [Dehalococcoidia bacterium]